MVFFWDFLFSFLTAIFLTVVFVAGLRRSGPWVSFLAFFFVVLLAAWAGGIWIAPVGPSVAGVYLISFVTVGLIVALILGAVAYPRLSKHSDKEVDKQAQETSNKERPVDLLFWVLIIILLIAIIAGYLIPIRTV